MNLLTDKDRTDRRRKLFAVTILAVPIIFLLSAVISGLGILGPWNTPRFAKMNWTHVEISYWVRTDPRRGGNGTERTFEMTDKSRIDTLRESLHIRKTSGDPLAGHGQLKITVDDKDVWLVDVVFEDRIDFCLEEDTYYSYVTELSDVEFYNSLRELCLGNEQKQNPHATLDHIKLRGNKGITSYPVLPEPDPQ